MNMISGFGDCCLTSSVCFIGGYALNKVSLEVNRLAVKYLGLPIDLLNHQEYENFSSNNVAWNQLAADISGIGLDRQLGAQLSIYVIAAIREEISYRFLLENMILSCVCHPMESMGISSLLFAARHLHNLCSNEALAGQFLNTALLGVICSLVQSHIGLVGSIFVHLGYNLHAYGWNYNLSMSSTVKAIRAIHREDVVHSIKHMANLSVFITDARSPFVLLGRAAKWGSQALIRKLHQN